MPCESILADRANAVSGNRLDADIKNPVAKIAIRTISDMEPWIGS